MSDDRKYREFWIYPFKQTGMNFCYKEPQPYKQASLENFDEIHVIEYRAYEELKQKLEVAKKALSTIADNSANDLSFYAAEALKEIEE